MCRPLMTHLQKEERAYRWTLSSWLSKRVEPRPVVRAIAWPCVNFIMRSLRVPSGGAGLMGRRGCLTGLSGFTLRFFQGDKLELKVFWMRLWKPLWKSCRWIFLRGTEDWFVFELTSLSLKQIVIELWRDLNTLYQKKRKKHEWTHCFSKKKLEYFSSSASHRYAFSAFKILIF